MTKPIDKRAYQQNTRLVELLRLRKLTIEAVARMIFCGPKSVIQVLRGHRKGTPTWNKLKRVLSADELLCAMNFANVKLAESHVKLELVDQGTEQQRIVATDIPVEEPEPLATEPAGCST